MRERTQSVEFDLRVGNSGALELPPEVARMLRPGEQYHVRLTGRSLAAVLRRKSISLEMIDDMGERQREPKENILRFLCAEGVLHNDRSFRRAAGKFRAKTG
jgi:hypothetical protein